ncbi:hypothetical protein FGB62_112g023 [Gracilaria domingensis]|nr:hypothetical protein FGB62_112g023 [Gracilaria domingensis]
MAGGAAVGVEPWWAVSVSRADGTVTRPGGGRGGGRLLFSSDSTARSDAGGSVDDTGTVMEPTYPNAQSVVHVQKVVWNSAAVCSIVVFGASQISNVSKPAIIISYLKTDFQNPHTAPDSRSFTVDALHSGPYFSHTSSTVRRVVRQLRVSYS